MRSPVHLVICCLLLGVFGNKASAGVGQTSDSLADAREYAATGRLANAEITVRAYIAQNPSSAEGHFLLGYVLFREQKAKESLAAYTEGAKYHRPAADDLKIVASDYVLLSDFSDADKWFSEVVQEKPSDADAWYLLGRAKYNENDFTAAVSSFERSLELRPKYVEAENNLGLCWKELGQQEKARAAFDTAIAWQGASPTDAQPFLNVASMLAESDDEASLKQALPYLTKADGLSPNNPKIHEALADVYGGLKDLPKAQGELERAVAIAPGISALHFKLGQVYRKEGMRAQAQEQFNICSRLSTAHSNNKTPNPLDASPSSPQ